MNDLYSHTCQDCGGFDLPNLADDSSEWDDIYTQIANDLLKDPNTTFNKDLYFKTAQKLIQGINEGLGGISFNYDDNRNVLSAYLKNNIYAFSAAKSFSEITHFRDSMLDEKGNILSFGSFKKRIANDGYVFNNTHLNTEYNTAKQSAIMAHKWETLDTECLEYSTVGDGKVRNEHRLLDKLTLPKNSTVWNRIMPQNDWNCRCTVIPGKNQNVKYTDAEAGKLAKQIVTNPLFDNNVGKSKVIFKDQHPYFKNANGKEIQLSWEQYGLQSLEKIKMATDLPIWKEKTIEQYNDWWNKNVNKSGNEIVVKDNLGTEILFTERFKTHINDDEPRFKYGTELKNIIENPDEIWSTIDSKNKKLNTFYLKYYDVNEPNKTTGAITIMTHLNEAHSLYEIDTENRLKELRRGLLKFASKK
ncbi:MAG: hypothetical protein K2Q03_06050 [Sphingobacteriaceae bacterium]|nr:hypothetical protein [Sphingobacteriaceae bacterium]